MLDERDALAARVAKLEAEITRRERLTIDQAMVEMVDERCRLAEGVVGDVSLALKTMRARADAAEARVRVLEGVLRSCRNLTHLQHETPQDVRQIGLMVAAAVDKALAATGKAGV